MARPADDIIELQLVDAAEANALGLFDNASERRDADVIVPLGADVEVAIERLPMHRVLTFALPWLSARDPEEAEKGPRADQAMNRANTLIP